MSPPPGRVRRFLRGVRALLGSMARGLGEMLLWIVAPLGVIVAFVAALVGIQSWRRRRGRD